MTTKEQERKALAQIRKIVEGLGENSYIGTAFEGCFEIAEQNIENDWACSQKQELEGQAKLLAAWDQKCRGMAEKIKALESALEAEKKERQANAFKAQEKANLASRMADEFEALRLQKLDIENAAGVAETKVAELQDEVIRLKARLFDLMDK